MEISALSTDQLPEMVDVANDGDPKLGLGCSIFLSHSGADKDFVRFLNEALRHSGYLVFYDEESLPKAERVSMRNILAELKNVKLAVLLLSDAFFTRTQHPMSELATIVKAGIQMLPVFYEFSVDQFKTKCHNQEWLTAWNRWVDEKKINKDIIKYWEEHALKALSGTNGIEYCKEANNLLELRNKIVAKVCQILKPDLPFSAVGVQGMDRLCQVVSECFAKSLEEPCTKPLVDMSLSKQNVVGGMYGISGIGKSTLCQALCDFFYKDFNAKVYHIELGDHTKADVRKRLDSFLTWLTGGIAPPQHLTDDQLWNMLKDHNQRSGSLPMFLAIDNVQIGSMAEAEKYLKCGPFPSGSKIFLTSQSADILKALLVGNDNAFYYWIQSITHLSFEEAKKIFLRTLYSREHTDLSHEQGCVVDECVKVCTLNKSKSDYYPMLLIVLASYMRQTSLDPLHWHDKMEELRRDGIFTAPSTHIHNLEKIFKRLYDSLTKDQQQVLLDLALYLPDEIKKHSASNVKDVMYWLDNIYPDKAINRILSEIAYSSLVDIRFLHVHDLVREFVKKEGTKSCTERVFKEHQIVKPSWRPWENCRSQRIERVGILRCQFEDPALDLSCIEELMVLHLIHNEGLKEVQLSEAAWSSLQSVIVRTSSPIKISIVKEHRAKKKRGKKNWAFHVDVQDCEIPSEAICLHKNSNSLWRNVVSLQLQNVRVYGQGGFCLEGFRQLQYLELRDLPDLTRINFGFDRCPYIEDINLFSLPNLEAISGLENNLSVESLFIRGCNSLRSLVLLDKCAFYTVWECHALERIELCPSQLETQLESMETDDAAPYLSVQKCSPMQIIGLSQRKFIRAVQYNSLERPYDDWYFSPDYQQPLMPQGFKCSPEMVEQMFKFSEDRSEQQIRTATIEAFSLADNGLSMVVMKDVQDTCSYLSALECTSASSLENLEVRCSREEGACGCHRLPCQPHFDSFKMTLSELIFFFFFFDLNM